MWWRCGAPQRRDVHEGAAPPSAPRSLRRRRRVEARRAGKLLGSAPTIGGEGYEGRWAGRVRFALLRLPKGSATRACGCAHSMPAARRSPSSHRARSTSSPTVVSCSPDRRVGFAGRRRASASRRSPRRCSTSTTRPSSGVSRSASPASGAGAARRADASAGRRTPTWWTPSSTNRHGTTVSTEETATRRFRLLHGVVDGGRATVSVVLGDGRRLRSVTARFEEAGSTAYAAVVPAGDAIRDLRVRRAGVAARTVTFSAPPLAVSCASGSPAFNESVLFDPSFNFATLSTTCRRSAPRPGGDGRRRRPDSGSRTAAGESLCLAVRDRPFTALSCVDRGAGLTSRPAAPWTTSGDRARSCSPCRRTWLASASAPRAAPRGNCQTVAGERVRGALRGPCALRRRHHHGLPRLRAHAASRRRRQGPAHGDRTPPTSGRLAPPKVFPARRLAGAPWPAVAVADRRARRTGARARCLAVTPADRRRPAPAAAPSAPAGSVIVTAPCTTRRLTVAIVAAGGSQVGMRSSRRRSVQLPLRAEPTVTTLPPVADCAR